MKIYFFYYKLFSKKKKYYAEKKITNMSRGLPEKYKEDLIYNTFKYSEEGWKAFWQSEEGKKRSAKMINLHQAYANRDAAILAGQLEIGSIKTKKQVYDAWAANPKKVPPII